MYSLNPLLCSSLLYAGSRVSNIESVTEAVTSPICVETSQAAAAAAAQLAVRCVNLFVRLLDESVSSGLQGCEMSYITEAANWSSVMLDLR